MGWFSENAPRTPVMTSAPAVEAIGVGHTYSTPSGQVKVSGLDGDNINFTVAGSDGKRSSGTLHVKQFQEMLVPQAPNLKEGAASAALSPNAQMLASPDSINQNPPEPSNPIQPQQPQEMDQPGPTHQEPANSAVPVVDVAPSAAPSQEVIQTEPVAAEPTGGATEKPKDKHEFASTHVSIPGTIADKIVEYGGKIPDASLARKGAEDSPHVTVLYGIHADEIEPVRKALAGIRPINVKIRGLSIFPNTETEDGKADVLKLNVDSRDLRAVNAALKKAIPHTSEFKNYSPHVTVAYLNPGEGRKFAGGVIKGVSGQTIRVSSITFSGKDGAETEIPLG